MHVKPTTPGLKVPIPGQPGIYVPEQGMRVTKSTYWRRRLRAGDVVEISAAKVAAPKATPKKD
jgi:hypothetical protein